MKRIWVKRAFLFFALSTVLLALQFLNYLFDSTVIEVMNFEGWMFFLASCVSHAATFALIPFLLALPFLFLGWRKMGVGVQITGVVLLTILNFLNEQVFTIYRFHINGFVLNMVFGDSAGEIFTFDTLLYVKEISLFMLWGGLVGLCYWLSQYIWRKRRKAYVWAAMGCIVGCTLYAHVWHIYGSFFRHQSVVKSGTLLPYYFPTTSYSLMTKLGFEAPDGYTNLAMGGGGDICYPVEPLQTVKPDSLPNIVLILVDSWNKRSLTPECMPRTYQFAQEHQWYRNHVSCSNGTRSSVYGLFFGLSCYYWETFVSSQIKPLFIDRLLELGYDFKAYPSAPLTDPPFDKVLFSRVPDLRVNTEGNTMYERDTKITDDFIAGLDTLAGGGRPFFSFLFYDGPHSFQIAPENNKRFTPAWDYADYTKLDKDLNPTPFFNLYRNCCYYDDREMGRVYDAIQERGMLDNTIIIITGDHAQEFNENGRNYWGHNSNFSVHQIGVPFICHFPGDSIPALHDYRTTHYDLVPTLMRNYLGVENPLSDYSAGHLLTDSTASRLWHVAGSNLNYAFLVEGDTILEKRADGGLDVYGPDMKPVTDYHIDIKAFNKAVEGLNHFFKK